VNEPHTWRLTKQLMPCATIFSHFCRILSFSAASMSATWIGNQGGYVLSQVWGDETINLCIS